MKNFDDPIDASPSPEELAAAEALARGLDHSAVLQEGETIALLTHAQGKNVPEIPPVEAFLPALATKTRKRRRRWLFPGLLVPVAAGTLLLASTLTMRSSAPVSGVNPRLAAPAYELLIAQARAASGDLAALSTLDQAMRRVRGHSRVDRLIDEGKVDEAEQVLTTLLQRQIAGSQIPAYKDAYFRLAQVALSRRDAKKAIAHSNAGLSLGQEPDLFTANLFIIRGAAYEALNEKANAVEDFQAAMRINEALLGKVLQP